METSHRVPLTLLCGSLGSGKTTLLRSLLTSAPAGERIAVVENEAASTGGVERALALEGLPVRLRDDEELFVELPNGCVCCSVKGAFLEAVETLVGRRRDLTRVVVELSGLADPGPVAAALWADEELQSPVVLDGVVCVVDAVSFPAARDEDVSTELTRQLAYADRVLVNKTDAVPPERVAAVVERVREINPHAALQRASLVADPTRVPLSFYFGVSTIDVRTMVEGLSRAVVGHHQHHHLHAHEEHSHNNDVRAIVVRRTQPTTLMKLREWLGTLLWERHADGSLFRIKGIVECEDGSAVAVQAVHQAMQIETMPRTFAEVAKSAKLDASGTVILIGKGLDESVLGREFEELPRR